MIWDGLGIEARACWHNFERLAIGRGLGEPVTRASRERPGLPARVHGAPRYDPPHEPSHVSIDVTGGLYGDGRGWFAWPSPEYEQVIRPTDWNEMLLKVEGNRMVSVLNGITVLDFTDPSPRSFDGYIALQLHSGGLGNMRFKDIFVRDLSVRTGGSDAPTEEG